MNYDSYTWKSIKGKDLIFAEQLLRANENNYVSACGRFLAADSDKNKIWGLYEKKSGLRGLLIGSRTTVIPVFCGNIHIPKTSFLKWYQFKKKIHSVQGRTNEVFFMENEMQKIGMSPVDLYDYDLMTLDRLPLNLKTNINIKNVILRKPNLNDIEQLLPLRKGYEEEEVLPKGSVFNPDAGKVTLKNFINNDKILVAELNGKIVGKIVVNAVSFTRYQIGGVFVLPEYRGRGIAALMTHEFAASIINEGRGITLFVKKNNLPAKKLYTGLGFSAAGDYRIVYY